MKIKVVLHRSFGGFYLNDEMASWLITNKNWELAEYDGRDENELKLETIYVGIGSDYYCPNQDKIEFRSHPDLIECVRAIKKLHENDVYPESYYGHIHSFKIADVEVTFGIEDYNDGYERVNVNTDIDFEKED